MTKAQRAKTGGGRFFEDFSVGEVLAHATPRTFSHGDVALYSALFGTAISRSSRPILSPHAIGYPRSPIDDLLAFHIVFGKTVADISHQRHRQSRLCRLPLPRAGLSRRHADATSQVIGLKENSNRESGVVYVRTRRASTSIASIFSITCAGSWCANATARPRPRRRPSFPNLLRRCPVDTLGDACPALNPSHYDLVLAGSPHCWGDYAVGEKIDHVDGVTVEEAEHQIATRLFQNNAKVHFNQFSEGQGRFGRRLVYGGHVISLARALSFNGLANAFHIAAINGGRHVAPLFAGDTVFAWSEILERDVMPGREDVGALRVRTVATKNRPCADFPLLQGEAYDPAVILDLDYWVLAPR